MEAKNLLIIGLLAASFAKTLDAFIFNNEKQREPVDCVMTEWRTVGPCMKLLGEFKQKVTRTVEVHPSNGGKACPIMTIKFQKCTKRIGGDEDEHRRYKGNREDIFVLKEVLTTEDGAIKYDTRTERKKKKKKGCNTADSCDTEETESGKKTTTETEEKTDDTDAADDGDVEAAMEDDTALAKVRSKRSWGSYRHRGRSSSGSSSSGSSRSRSRSGSRKRRRSSSRSRSRSSSRSRCRSGHRHRSRSSGRSRSRSHSRGGGGHTRSYRRPTYNHGHHSYRQHGTTSKYSGYKGGSYYRGRGHHGGGHRGRGSSGSGYST